MISLSSKLTVRDIDVKDKRVLVRMDFNVPLSGDGQTVLDNYRIVAAIPTIKLLQEKGARVIILMSHLGRPDGIFAANVNTMSLKPVAKELGRLLGSSVHFMADCVGVAVEEACKSLLHSESRPIVLLENLRFHLEEEISVKRKDKTVDTASPDKVCEFRAGLSRLGDIYVNDAFGTAHRAHSSIVGVDLQVRVAGLLMEKELRYFSQVLESPDRIDLAILGGSKVSDKIKLIQNMLPRIRNLVIGGAMAFTFLKVLHNMNIGKSLFDEQGVALVPKIMQNAQEQGVNLVLPVDFVTGSSINEDARIGKATIQSGIPEDMLGLDIGPESAAKLTNLIMEAKKVLWNGPVGVFEVSHFAKGTHQVANALCKITSQGATTIACGGDTGAAVAKWNLEKKLSHVSTGGGAALELLEGKSLPGIEALSNKSELE